VGSPDRLQDGRTSQLRTKELQGQALKVRLGEPRVTYSPQESPPMAESGSVVRDDAAYDV
jgi:hypothetical protein